jgi:hypothetical protein
MGEVVRRAVLAYSFRNRRRKAANILEWMRSRQVEDVLFVGAMGDEGSHNPACASAGIVENAIAANFPVKMGINVVPANTSYPFMVADARNMPFPDDYVDFALANAVIEHVGQELEQQAMVDEMTRVARSWVITTPNRWFPVESHTATLFAHWLPSWRKRRPETDFTRLLSKREFAALLPPGAELRGRVWSPTFTATHGR